MFQCRSGTPRCWCAVIFCWMLESNDKKIFYFFLCFSIEKCVQRLHFVFEIICWMAFAVTFSDLGSSMSVLPRNFTANISISVKSLSHFSSSVSLKSFSFVANAHSSLSPAKMTKTKKITIIHSDEFVHPWSTQCACSILNRLRVLLLDVGKVPTRVFERVNIFFYICL